MQQEDMCRIYHNNLTVNSAEIIGYGAFDGQRIITIDLEGDNGTIEKIGFTPEVAVELADRIIELYISLEIKK